MKKENIRLENLTWSDIQQKLEEGVDTVVFGIGATEQHGSALPLLTDAHQADYMAHFLAQNLPNTLQAPTIRIGYSQYHIAFPGTISLRKSTLAAVIEDYLTSFIHHGFKKIIIFISHGGNLEITQEVIHKFTRTHPKIRIIYYYKQDAEKILGKLCQQFRIDPTQIGTHAGDMEASIMMYLKSDLVHPDRFKQGYLGHMTPELRSKFREEGIESLSDHGVIGDQTQATSKKGQIYVETFQSHILGYIQKKLAEEG